MIGVNNLTRSPIDEEFLRKIAKKVLIGENKKSLQLSIVLVGPDRIKELNKKYRQKNRPTDILSFSYDNSGEMVICLKEVKKDKKELARVLIHGTLHILGYDHEKGKKKAKKMGEKEEYYLRKIYAQS